MGLLELLSSDQASHFLSLLDVDAMRKIRITCRAGQRAVEEFCTQLTAPTAADCSCWNSWWLLLRRIPHCKALHVLGTGQPRLCLWADTLRQILDPCISLEVLSIRDCSWSVDGAAVLATTPLHSLRRLTLQWASLGSQGAAALASAAHWFRCFTICVHSPFLLLLREAAWWLVGGRGRGREGGRVLATLHTTCYYHLHLWAALNFSGIFQTRIGLGDNATTLGDA